MSSTETITVRNIGSHEYSMPLKSPIERNGISSSMYRKVNCEKRLKRVSSTGDMNDERAAIVGLERRWHKRRDKSRIEHLRDVSDDQRNENEAENKEKEFLTSEHDYITTAFTSVESSERSHDSTKGLLKMNKKNRILSDSKRSIMNKEKPPSFHQPHENTTEWIQSLQLLAANAATENIARSSRLTDNVQTYTSDFVARSTSQSASTLKPQSVWVEAYRKDRSRRIINELSESKMLFRLDQKMSSLDDRILKSLPKPKLKRIQTAPSSMQTKNLSVVDDALMNRALSIRENLRHYEMVELAIEAEKAAESGLERFVGNASKFVMEDSPPHNQHLQIRDDDDFLISPYRSEVPFVSKQTFKNWNALDCTPFNFGRKKIKVTALREFSEVIPTFSEMHYYIRIHLAKQGVNELVLTELSEETHIRAQGTADDDGNSVAAGSIVSFGSFAVASLKEIVQYVGGSRKSSNSATSASMLQGSRPSFNHSSALSPWSDFDEDNFSKISDKGIDSCCGSPHSEANLKKRSTCIQLNKQSTGEEPVKIPTSTSESDDSSIELYGRNTGSLNFERIDAGLSLHKRRSCIIDATFPLDKRGNRYSRSESEPVDVKMKRVDLFGSNSIETHGSQTPSVTSLPLSPVVRLSEKSQRIPTIINRIQNKFSLCPDDTKKVVIEPNETENFISNYFYTSQNAGIISAKGVVHLKLDINPDVKRNEEFCISGCGHSGLLSSCETVGNVMDIIFNWITEKGECDQTTYSSSFDQSKSPQIVFHQSWVSIWQTEDGNQRQFLMPPRLAVKR